MSNLITPPPYFSDVVAVGADEYPACTARMDQRFPDIVSLQFVRAGSCWFGRDGAPAALLDRPAIFWHVPEETYQYWPGPGGTWHHLWASFRGERVGRIVRLGFAALAPSGFVHVRQRDPITDLFRRLGALARSGRAGDAPAIARTLEDLLALVMAERLPAAASADPARRAILAVARRLERRPFDRADWAGIAAAFSISESHFRRLFRATIGTAPQAFLLRARVRRAAAALAEPNRTVKSVALAAGYADAAQFTKSFRAVMGVSPSTYRQLHAAGEVSRHP